MFTKTRTTLCKLHSKQWGGSMIEYALIVGALVALATAFFADGGTLYEAIETKLSDIASSLSS